MAAPLRSQENTGRVVTCVSERCQDSDVVWVRAPEYDAAAAEEVIGEASPSPRGRWRLGRIFAWALAAAAVIATASVAVVRDVGGPAPAPGPVAARPVAARAAVAEGHYAVPIGAHRVIAMAATGAAIYTLTAEPAQLTRQDGTPAPARVPAPLGATDLLVDHSTGRLWVFAAADGDGATASSYDLATLARLSVVRLPSQVNSAAVLGDAIWLGTGGGVYVLRRGATAAALVSPAWPDVVSVVADPARNRLLAVTIAMPAQLLSITPSGTIWRIAQLPTGRSSLAIVDGAVWVAGFGPADHVFRLDPDAWRVGRPLEVDRVVGAGATISPGQHVVWVSYAAGVSCLDARTGATLARWPGLGGPIAARRGILYSMGRSGLAQHVIPRGCPG
jgi:hypothetical protein